MRSAFTIRKFGAALDIPEPELYEYSDDTKEKLKQIEAADWRFLGDLPRHPLWLVIVDLWASRTVFQRLWTVQEIGLAPEIGSISCAEVSR
jgi:hypothetical protein